MSPGARLVLVFAIFVFLMLSGTSYLRVTRREPPVTTHAQQHFCNTSVTTSYRVYPPRDAGFFSVLNFYVATMLASPDERIYPFWSRDSIQAPTKGKPGHFCYWCADIYNSWFEYFEPVSFFPGDCTMLHNTSYIGARMHDGGGLAGFIMDPGQYRQIATGNQIEFTATRKKVNQFYKKVIPRTDLRMQIDRLWENNVKENQFVIGVHFRHPVHSVEAGKITMEDYYIEIDAVLALHQDASIFLASDVWMAIDDFKRRYPNRLFFYDGATRVDGNTIVEMIHLFMSGARMDGGGFFHPKGGGNAIGFELHHHIAGKDKNCVVEGKDVVRDVWTLARSNHFIGQTSNLAQAVSYLNPDIEIKIIKH